MRKDRYYSKRQLEKQIRKMGEIIMIGALASIEETFGHLWGEDKEDGYTKDEEEMYEKWEQLRTEILDKGNKNIEYMINLLRSFKVNMDKPGSKIEFKREENNG